MSSPDIEYREHGRQVVGRLLIHLYGSVNADELRAVDAIPAAAVDVAEWLALEDAAAQRRYADQP